MADYNVNLVITNNSSYPMTYDAGHSSTMQSAKFDPAPPATIAPGDIKTIVITDDVFSQGAGGTVCYCADTGTEKKYYSFTGSCPVWSKKNYETGPGKVSGTGSSGHPVFGYFTITDTTAPSWSEGTVTPVMQQIETVVFFMLENRSLDNVLGMLYSGANPPNVVPTGSSPKFDGVPLTNINFDGTVPYSPSDGCSHMNAPSTDPGEDYGHVQKQFYADGNGNFPKGFDWTNTTPPMTGFVFDYDHGSINQEVMGSYNKAQLPALYGLAENYAVSDAWFCSIPTQTFCNRAFSICGTSLGLLDNSEVHGTASVFHSASYANSRTIFNVLADQGKSWGFYYVDTYDSELAAGSPVVPYFHPFTPYYFPQMLNAANGGVHATDGLHTDANAPFMKALQAGTLPNFCYLEPAWGGAAGPIVIQGTDLHPPTNVGVGDDMLADLFNAIQTSPQWDKMLLVITFDEHGGTYDHVPPPLTVRPDDSTPSSNAENGFNFQRLGARVPTLLISPFIPKGTVFRSEVTGTAYDHTSFIATLCKWVGIDPKSGVMGARAAQAPTFENVLCTTARTDKPVISGNNTPAPKVAGTINPFSLPAPKDVHGKDLPARPIHFGDLHAAIDASETPEEFALRFKKLRYPG